MPPSMELLMTCARLDEDDYKRWKAVPEIRMLLETGAPGPTPSDQLVILCLELQSGDYVTWHSVPEFGPVLREGIREAARRRLALAKGLLAAAQALLSATPSDTDARNAISRAYYACHHGARAVALVRESRDRDMHEDALEHLAKAAASEAALRVLGPRDLERRLKELMDHRHTADYRPMGTAVPGEAPLDCGAAAPLDVSFAEQVVKAVETYMGAQGVI